MATEFLLLLCNGYSFAVTEDVHCRETCVETERKAKEDD
jgi:hypothetical protein